MYQQFDLLLFIIFNQFTAYVMYCAMVHVCKDFDMPIFKKV